MSALSANTNRPVHLARRDAAYERAVTMLYMPVSDLHIDTRVRHLEQVIELLRYAVHCAREAIRHTTPIEREKDFLHFLQLILQNVETVHALMRNQAHLEEKEHNFLARFLGAHQDHAALSAINYRRRADDMLQGLWQVLRMSHGPYQEQQALGKAAMSEDESRRYRLAYESFDKRLEKRCGMPEDLNQAHARVLVNGNGNKAP